MPFPFTAFPTCCRPAFPLRLSSLRQCLRLRTVCPAGLREVSVDTWLQVIPQIVARIDIPRQKVRAQIRQLLVRVGEAHPQALLFPLLVSAKSTIAGRQKAALDTLNEIRKSSRQLIEEATMVSRELDRIAVLWNEEWHAGLEEACKNFTNGNTAGMLDQLDRLHESLHRGPETLREVSFQQARERNATFPCALPLPFCQKTDAFACGAAELRQPAV